MVLSAVCIDEDAGPRGIASQAGILLLENQLVAETMIAILS